MPNSESHKIIGGLAGLASLHFLSPLSPGGEDRPRSPGVLLAASLGPPAGSVSCARSGEVACKVEVYD